MDVFGTIINTINLANKIVIYIQAVKDAKKVRLELLSEVSALGALLEILRRRLGSTNADGTDDGISVLLKAGIKGPLFQCYKDLQSTAKKLKRIASHTNTRNSFSFLEKMKNIAWPFRQEDIRTMLSKMERLKSLIMLALQTSVMEFIKTTRGELKDLGLDVEGIEDAVLAIERAQRAHMMETQLLRVGLCDLVIKSRDSANGIAKIKDEIATIGRNQQDQMIKDDQMHADLTVIKESVYNQELQDLVKWLSPLDFGEKHNMIFGKCARDTGGWFLKSPKFLAWRRGDLEYKTLWCPGHAGVGKSVMVSLVVTELGKDIPENTALVFIYFEYKTKYTVSQLVEVILKQLMGRRVTKSGLESLRKHVATGKRPTSEELFDVLKLEVGTYDRVLFVIDALDEADVEVWTPLLTRLQALPTISLLATSRDTGEIELGLHQYQRLDIMADEGDMKKYIEDRLKSSTKLKRLLKKDTCVYKDIVVGIMKKADGMFLLAQLHLNSLEMKSRVTDLRRALDELPDTLDATYGEAMSRISDRALAYRIISWLIHAVQPMTIHDLQYALAVEDGMTAFDVGDLHDEASLTSVCVGLVVLRENAVPEGVTDPRTNDKIVGLVHYTAQEYFLHSPNLSVQFVDSPHFAITCLRYLAFDIFNTDGPLDEDTQKRLAEIPFAKYAMWSWGVHARAHCDDKTVWHLAMELLHDSRRVVTVGSRPCYTKNLSALHLSARFGLEDHLEFLLDNGCDINSRDSEGDTVISYAAIFGHEEIIQLLLARGVNINTKGGNGTTPLSAAVSWGREEIVQLLLARNGLDVNPRDSSGDTPIIDAAWNGHIGTVDLLLAHDGVDINSQNQNGTTPLSAAAQQGHEGVVRLLLTRDDLDLDPRNIFGNTPIILAARNGHRSTVELLLAQDGVDINSQGQNGSTPLSAAVSKGHEEIVQLLLARDDLDANLRNSSGDTPIIDAAWKGYGGIVKLLLARDGVDVNSRGQNGITPLSAAARQGHKGIVQLLLARDDLDVNLRNSSGDTPIIDAARKGYDGIVELLLARGGVDVNSQGQNGTTPLSAAARHGHEGVARLLLTRNDLDLNPRNSFGVTPIILVAWNGNSGLAELLLARDDVDINSQSQNGSTPLSAATRQGHEGVVRLLLARNDLDLNPRDSFGVTPIILAAWNGHSGLVGLLLTRDVDINSQSQNGSTPLSAAASKGHEEVVQLLLARDDLDVNPRDSFGDTPIILAARNGHSGLVRLLLARDSVDINSQDQNGTTPLLAAASKGHEGVVQLLLARNDLDVNLRDSFGDTPIILAAWNGHCGIVELLLARDGVDINSQNQNEATPLLAAIMRGHDAIVQLLLASADLSTNWRSSEGITYLAMATRHKNEKAAKWLLAQGDMDANPKNSKGQGPIAMAADQDNDAIVKFFLDRDGIDINQARSGGKTPLDHATQQRRECVIELPHTAGGRMDVELKVESKGCRQESEQDKEDEKAGDDRRVKNVWEMKTLRRAERIGRKNKTRKQD